MQRRQLISLLGTAALVWFSSARAQQSAKTPLVGVLLYGNPTSDPNVGSFRRAIQELGYVEGQNIAIEYRYADGKPDLLPNLAIELVGLNPDIIFSLGGDLTPFVVKATRSIPIVFVTSADPVAGGLVASLPRPGGNATGVTFLQDELTSKRFGLLKMAAPHISRVAFLWNPDHPDYEKPEAQRAASALGVELLSIEMRGPADLDGALQAITQQGADALYVASSRHTVASIARIAAFASQSKLPLAGGWGSWAQGGGLISYGPNVDNLVRTATTYVDRILKGARPADLPVQAPTKFQLIVNLKTAKALGLSLPPTLLALADIVIQ